MRFITVIVNCGLIIPMPTASRFTHPPPQTLNRFDVFGVLDLADFSGFHPRIQTNVSSTEWALHLRKNKATGALERRIRNASSQGSREGRSTHPTRRNPTESAGGELTGPRWGPWASEITARSGVTSEKATAGFGVTHGLHRQSPPAHPHTGMKVATIADSMPGLRIDFGENDRMDRGSNPSRSSLSFDRSFDPSWGSSWSLPEGRST